MKKNHELNKPKKVMQIERFLSRTEVIVTIIAIEDIFFFFAGNFLFLPRFHLLLVRISLWEPLV